MVLKRRGQLKAFQLSMHSYLRTNDQLCSNQFDITASADQEWEVLAIYFEGWRGKSSLWPVSLYFSSRGRYRGSVLVSPNPPVPLLIGRLSPVPSCRVVTVGRLVIEHCTSFSPGPYSAFKVELAGFDLDNKRFQVQSIYLTVYFMPPTQLNV